MHTAKTNRLKSTLTNILVFCFTVFLLARCFSVQDFSVKTVVVLFLFGAFIFVLYKLFNKLPSLRFFLILSFLVVFMAFIRETFFLTLMSISLFLPIIQHLFIPKNFIKLTSWLYTLFLIVIPFFHTPKFWNGTKYEIEHAYIILYFLFVLFNFFYINCILELLDRYKKAIKKREEK